MAFSPTVGPAVADLIAEELRLARGASRHVSVVFEQIKDMANDCIVGHEVLTRPAFDVTPLHWYSEGRALGLMEQLEARAIELALSAPPGGSTLLTVNFSLDVVDSAPVQAVLRELARLPRAVAVELSENHHTSGKRLQASLEYMRGLGLLVAVDDAGTGESGPEFVRQVQPEIIKVDHTHTWALNYSAGQRRFVETYLVLAAEQQERTGQTCQVIIEGVSSQFVADAVLELGEKHDMNLLAQGYWITRTTPIDLREVATPLPAQSFGLLG